MNVEQMRDEVARRLGWTKSPIWTPVYNYWVEPGKDFANHYGHPIPDGDLTTLAALWPEGWDWEVAFDGDGYTGWINRHGDDTDHEMFTGPSEYECRLKMLLAVLGKGRGG